MFRNIYIKSQSDFDGEVFAVISLFQVKDITKGSESNHTVSTRSDLVHHLHRPHQVTRQAHQTAAGLQQAHRHLNQVQVC